MLKLLNSQPFPRNRNFDDVLVPEDHVSRSYNDTYYVDSHTVLRCHTRAHQAELLGKGHTHFLVTGDVIIEILSTQMEGIMSSVLLFICQVICVPTVQMEGFRIFNPEDWEPSGMDGTSYAAEDLSNCLEGLARHHCVPFS